MDKMIDKEAENSIHWRNAYMDCEEKLAESKSEEEKLRCQIDTLSEMISVSVAEVERLRAALQSIENFTISPYHPAILARRALAGEEE